MLDCTQAILLVDCQEVSKGSQTFSPSPRSTHMAGPSFRMKLQAHQIVSVLRIILLIIEGLVGVHPPDSTGNTPGQTPAGGYGSKVSTGDHYSFGRVSDIEGPIGRQL